jgi:hypothetical protein
MRNLGSIRGTVRDVSLLRNVQIGTGAPTAPYSVGPGGVSPEVMRPGSEQLMKARSNTTTPPYIFMMRFLIKHSDITSFCLVLAYAISVIKIMNNNSFS